MFGAEIIVAIGAIAATLAIASIAATWKLANELREITSQETQHRHNLRTETARMLSDTEQRVTARVVELERNVLFLAGQFGRRGDLNVGD